MSFELATLFLLVCDCFFLNPSVDTHGFQEGANAKSICTMSTGGAPWKTSSFVFGSCFFKQKDS